MLAEIAIGRVRKTHGVKGYLKVMSFSGKYDHFYDLKTIILKNKDKTRTFEIEKVSPLSGEILMKLVGIDSPEAGKLLSGWDIWTDRTHAVECDRDEFYHADLVNCRLILEGKDMGTVQSVLEAGADDLLEIKSGDETKLIPFNKVFIGKVDIKNKTIELLEGWILD